jgi:transcriptional regulator with XRE-family HTH domain
VNTLTDWLSTEERRMQFAEEALIVDVAEQIWSAMTTAKVTKSEIAQKLGKSKALVSQLLNGSRNLTLRSLADIAFTLGYRVDVSLNKVQAVNEWHPLNDAIVVQFDQRLLNPAPVDEVRMGTWTTINTRAA